MIAQNVALRRELFTGFGSINVVSLLVGGFDEAAGARVREHAEALARRLPAGVGLLVHDRDDAAFGAWIRELLLATEPPEAAALEAAPIWVELAGHTEDRADHGALVAVLQVARWLLGEAGARGVLWDGLTLGWRPAAELPDTAPGELRLAAWWRLELIDGFVDAEGGRFVCACTLGLARFGRPDLLAFGSASNRPLLERLVAGLAKDLVDGAVLRPGDVIEKGGLRLQVEPYRPGENAPALDVPFFAPPLVLVPLD